MKQSFLPMWERYKEVLSKRHINHKSIANIVKLYKIATPIHDFRQYKINAGE